MIIERKLFAVLAAALLCTACKAESHVAPTAPGGPAIDPSCPPSADVNQNCAPAKVLTVLVSLSTAGPFSYTLGGLTLSGTGNQYTRIVGLSPGTLELSGQVQGNIANVRVGIPQSDVGGSIPPASVQSVEGPTAPNPGGGLPCSFFYSQNSGPISFRIRFTLNAAGTPNFNDSCH